MQQSVEVASLLASTRENSPAGNMDRLDITRREDGKMAMDTYNGLNSDVHVVQSGEPRGSIMGSENDPTPDADRYKAALEVYVVWHPRFEAGKDVARFLLRNLFADPDQPFGRSLGIPVKFRSSTRPDELPPPIPFGQVERTAVVILADRYFVGTDAWSSYGEELVERSQRWTSLVLPVAYTNPDYLPKKLRGLNAIRLVTAELGVPDPKANRELLNDVMHALCTLLDPSTGKVTIFLSHAAHDGRERTAGIWQYLTTQARLNGFLDAQDIPDGSDFAKVIDEKARRASGLLAVQTDDYASRDWCRREVLIAKRNRLPVVVLSDVTDKEPRAFPYLGNVPVVRWREGVELELTRSLLTEVLRTRYFPLRVRQLCAVYDLDDRNQVMSGPPELLSLFNSVVADHRTTSDDGLILYPDPPIGREEEQLLRDANNQVEWVTPTTIHRQAVKVERARELTVAFSLSEPSSEELMNLGMSEDHLRYVYLELARHLLVLGYRLAYGGDWRSGGFSESLADLVGTYAKSHDDDRKWVDFYTVRSHGTDVDADRRARIANFSRVREIPARPQALENWEQEEDCRAWGRALELRFMRKWMAEETGARIILGGRTDNYQGYYPGVVEEAALTLAYQKPLYVVGGFGGAAAFVTRALEGKLETLLPDRFGEDTVSRCQALANLPGNWSSLATVGWGPSLFKSCGIKGIANGLTVEENRRLGVTTDLDEIVELVLEGLTRVSLRDH